MFIKYMLIVCSILYKKQDISGKEIISDLLPLVKVAMNYTFLYQKLGQRIEVLRKKKGMTQEGLAEKAQLHRAYFWDIERGRNISIKTAYNIARALEVRLSELFQID